MNTASEKISIFKTATAGMDAARTVYLQAACLLVAFGSLAKQLVPGVDLQERVDQQRKKLADEITRLQAEHAQATEHVRLGYAGARLRLDKVQRQLNQAQTGRLQIPAVVPVNVGALRELIEQVEQRPPATEPQQYPPARAPRPEVAAASE